MNSVASNRLLRRLSFLIQISADQFLFARSPQLFAGYHVFHRLSMPRHPPYTLSNLITFIDHRHTGRVQRRVRQQPGHTVNNVSSIAKKVLGDIRPTEKPGPQKDLVAIS